MMVFGVVWVRRVVLSVVLEPAFRGLLAHWQIIQKFGLLKGQNAREFFFRVFLVLKGLKFRGLPACFRIVQKFPLLKGQNAREFFFRVFLGLKLRGIPASLGSL